MKSTTRRGFLQGGLLVTAGAIGGGWLMSTRPPAQSAVLGATADDGAEARLKKLGIELPPAPKPVAVYFPAVVSGGMLYASGHGPRTAGGKLVTGRVGSDLTLAEGKAAARLVGLQMLATIRHTLGSLDRVVRLVKTLGMVNSTPDFTRQPQVINGFSELMTDVFGPTMGKGARSAVGMGSLPSNIPVEIEAIFEVRS